MGARGTTFGKLERERAKKAKAAAKRARREERAADTGEDVDGQETEAPDDGLGMLSAAELLALVEQTHRKFEAGTLSHEEYEEKKAELLARLPID